MTDLAKDAVTAKSSALSWTGATPSRPVPTNDSLPPLSEEQRNSLASTAQALAARGKGILAADESTRTVRTA